jgi:PAS domain S-box-containing protein
MDEGIRGNPEPGSLRLRAEARLMSHPDAGLPPDDHSAPARLWHELRVHQVELELQNEALDRARAQAEVELARYTELYDFAPVGLLTLDRQATIRRINLAAARLLGHERLRLQGSCFGAQIAATDRARFDAMLANALAGAAWTGSEFTLAVDRPSMFTGQTVQIEAACPDGSGECRLVMVNVTEHRRAVAALRDGEARIEALRHALALEQATETGRSEERVRIALELHDDIGARLLTLIHMAPSAALQDYLRHTLQDLKTLTYGLATPQHRLLSNVAADWRADLSARLATAGVALDWQTRLDADIGLDAVQWSALTRVLRELVSNAIVHARCRRLAVDLRWSGGRLQLVVRDDGEGRRPEAWVQGLGLGGVHKRIRLLGGEVALQEVEPQGIACTVRLPLRDAGPTSVAAGHGDAVV